MELKNIPYYTRSNLELLLGDKKRTLDARLLSLRKKGKLITLKRGYYLNNNYYSQTENKQNLLEYLSSLLVSPSYVSLEYALASYGFLAESVYTITCVTTKKTRTIKNDLINYNYHKISPKHYHSFISREFNDLQYSFATLEKSIWDLCYFTPLSSVGIKREFLLGSRFNWGLLNKVQKSRLTQLLKDSKSSKMSSILDILITEGIL